MSLWGWFTGADKAKKQANETYGLNKKAIGTGLQNELGYYGQARDQAAGYLQPWMQQGQQGQTAYLNLLGLNGAGAQTQAQGAYSGWNPYLNHSMDAATQAVARQMASRGNLNSGLAAYAQDRAARDLGMQDFGAYAAHLQGLGQQGLGVANALAGNAMGYGQLAGNAQRAATQGMLGNNTQTGNALSAANVSPMSFFLQNANMALSALTGKPPTMGGTTRPGTTAGGGGNYFTPSQMNSLGGYF